ncbi:hypothetical protein B5K05_33755 [Rhizobium phaseoli]|uniref:transcriptional regulator domain-containing protein n=1 Tax=Rhizobium phaseoli TaxID=396 RepID=UPI000E2BDD28|nr:hypothetical protein B5K05_33755 [Rhizobium phaseoli]RDJ00904.1 hypothetical protein B5K04_31065 [Rhizobium phaseoli]
MIPHTSDWRDRGMYDVLDTPEEFGWEFLRRSKSYQSYYRDLVMNGAESQPLRREEVQRWGLRFPGPARAFH